MNKLTITFFDLSPLTYGGGYETYIMKVIEKLSKNGHKINIVTGDQRLNDYIHLLLFNKLWEKRISKDYISEKLHSMNMYEYTIGSFLPFSKSFKDIRKIMINSDIIYTRNEIEDFLIIKHFCGKYAPSIVCGIHTAIIYPYKKSLMSKLHNILYKSPIYGRLLNICSTILTQNKFDTDIIAEYGIKKEKIIKLLPFVDTNYFHPMNIDRTDDKFKILFAGRLTEQKGVDILYKTIENISNKPEFKDMTFTIVGSGELEFMVNNLVNKYDNIHSLGFVIGEKLVELYNSHDVIILPSRWETALKVVLEAQACGLPVVVSNIPGPNELMIHDKTGYLTEPENFRDISEKILKILQLKKYYNEKYLEMKKLSVKNTNKYSVDTIVNGLENIFYNLSNIYVR